MPRRIIFHLSILFFFQKELFSESTTDKPSTSDDTSKHENLDHNLQLCFDLAIGTIEHISDSYRARSFEVRRTYENVCDVITYIAKRASKPSDEELGETLKNGKYRVAQKKSSRV